MKIVCAIDNLDSGGAQRQMVSLSTFLKRRGHDVRLLTYHPANFYLDQIRQAQVPVTCLNHVWKLARPIAFRRFFSREQPDAVLAFLEGPSLYSELAGLPGRKWGLVVSERIQISEKRRSAIRSLHRLADYVTTNSHANRRAIEHLYPELRGRIVTIFNCLDLDLFAGSEIPQNNEVRFVVAATFQPRKNTLGLIKAAALLKSQQPETRFRIDWHGESGADATYLQAAQNLINSLALTDTFFLHPASGNIAKVYAVANAIVLPSFQEGLPNTVCEAMACQRPVLASRIGDAEILVTEGENGMLFDPASIEDMARAMGEFCRSPGTLQTAMGASSRRRAEELFEPDAVVSKYESLLRAAKVGQAEVLAHWPPDKEPALPANQKGSV